MNYNHTGSAKPFIIHRISIGFTILFGILSLQLNDVLALPMDWHGVFGVDSTSIGNYTRASKSSLTAADDSYVINRASGEADEASFQSYLLKLRPSIIVNDSATFNAELTTGYGNGGRLGDSSTQSSNGSFGNALYLYNTSNANDSDSKLAIRKFNMELFSDTGTYVLGRQSSHWALGTVYNGGDNTWDRHSTIRDGVTAKYKIGHFNITPYWYKIDLSGGTRSDGLTSDNKTIEFGLSMLYDNPERDLAFGILFGQKKSKPNSTFIQTDINSTEQRPLYGTKVKITDIFFKKSFGKFHFALEVPIFSGSLNTLYAENEDSNTKYKSNSLIFESEFEYNQSWSVNLDAGLVKGDDGKNGSFKASFLHPNYQIANLLFRYNMEAISDPQNNNVFDSYVTNTKYLKFGIDYTINDWSWNASVIHALADQTAKAGGSAYNHEKNEVFVANFSQADDLGTEIDLSFLYRWNQNVHVGGNFGYLMVGDYYKFTNTATEQALKDPYLIQVNTSLSF